jgi:cell division protein FtsX
MVAFAFLRVGMFYLERIRDQVAIFEQLPLVGMDDFWSTWIVLLALGVLVSGVASLIALRRYVRV